jgi:hypothetical protein
MQAFGSVEYADGEVDGQDLKMSQVSHRRRKNPLRNE